MEGLADGTFNFVAYDANGHVVDEEFTTFGNHPGERPVHGFATSFVEADITETLAWHDKLRSTVVQIYDWMDTYTEPLGPQSGWEDPSHRPVSPDALRSLSSGLRAMGAVAHAYAPIYAVGHAFAKEHPEMLMYDDEGVAIPFLDQIILANPGHAGWQQHFAQSYGLAMDELGFNGLHVDTYGYPRVARNDRGESIDIRSSYESFLRTLRDARPNDLISFNQVNGVPSAAKLPTGAIFRYCEVWPPNSLWRHFEGLLDRSAGIAGHLASAKPGASTLRGSIACYPPVWGDGVPGTSLTDDERASALRTVVLTEAVATSLGASPLLYGDRVGVLCDPYYPKHARLSEREATTALTWRRFALRCRDLFIENEDTSWYEINDENGAVSLACAAAVSPEPTPGSLFARVVHGQDLVALSAVDLTGSAGASWSERTAHGSLRSVTVRVLLEQPERWRVEVAALGRNGGRFHDVETRVVAHRQGRAAEFELSLDGGWAVARLRPRAK